VPFQTFPAKDGWLVIGCAKEKFWQRLAAIVGRPELAEDPRFRTFDDRAENHGQLEKILDAELAAKTVAEWLELMRAASIPCAPINTIPQALADEHTLARDLIVSTEHPVFGTVRQVASPVRVGDTRVAPRRAPERGEHTEEVLRGLLGYSDDHIAQIRAAGAFGAV
jgi:crotonobetainyl-CoA:carnitine CoA-transferase CaiB-like acyl-CoA transferase